ncbi:VOC family protein [Actinokineospora guangxiensis]|uniref:VOC family protein n=1 Tax=Actinokineospora guangxiensis TaxID=1490288 RepID=A0ABW0EM26_9PSEU
MTPDPFDALRAADTPTDPHPDFTADLRERLRRAVLDWKDPAMPDTPPQTTQTPQTPQTTAPAPRVPEAETATAPAISPYIIVADARAAIDWYATVFAGHLRGEPYVMDDGRIGHAEIGVGDGVLMLADAGAAGDIPVAAPTPGAPHAHTLHVRVADVDAAYTRGLALGAAAERDPVDNPYGRTAVLVDPFGHRWMLNAAPAARPGDIGYATVVVRDAETAKAFYAAVLGWRYTPGSVDNGWQVADRQIGLWGGADPRVDLCFRVTDLTAALARVREAGGTAGQVDRKPYGAFAECADPEGTAFQLWEP